MGKFIMVGCDLHDAPIVLKVAEGRERPRMQVFKNTRGGGEGATGCRRQADEPESASKEPAEAQRNQKTKGVG
jgi:hypothetical protein